MNLQIVDEINAEINSFRLPRYNELPAIDLYIDQVVQIIERTLQPLSATADQVWITNSMINNYTKQGLIKRPVKKRYDREQVAYLIYICLTKSVMQIANIKELIRSQQERYSQETAYDFFCTEFENALQKVFNKKEILNNPVSELTEQIFLLSATVNTIAQQIYLNKYLMAIRQEEKAEAPAAEPAKA